MAYGFFHSEKVILEIDNDHFFESFDETTITEMKIKLKKYGISEDRMKIKYKLLNR